MISLYERTEYQLERVVKKEARGLDNADLGEVQGLVQGFVVTRKGLLNKNDYYFPQILVDRFDGQTLFLKVTDVDLNKYEKI